MITQWDIDQYKAQVELYKIKVYEYNKSLMKEKNKSEENIIDLSPSVDCNGNKTYAIAIALPNLNK